MLEQAAACLRALAALLLPSSLQEACSSAPPRPSYPAGVCQDPGFQTTITGAPWQVREQAPPEEEETEYIELLAAEKHQVEVLKNMQHQNKSLSMLDGIREDVRKAADRSEEEIEEHVFDDNKAVMGANFEAVLRVEEEEANSKRNGSKHEVEIIWALVC
ncbi:transmembrane and coiled-coil domain-containing protein 3-like [Monodelphis domestica]|uniref:transmembrane and coiled-coil domain-containing protein 3-like n=1 Tax=Monodelphis domestica TaxID=13616 RepID=UPI0024E200B2|nr:transmembrane and coiled-coil domain-containing protein 3-like [Monodelphis domestica]